MVPPPLANPFPEKIRSIGLFSLSGPHQNDPRLQPGLALFKQWGLSPNLPPLSNPPLRYLAGTDEQRLKSFHQQLGNPDLDFLMATRGGFGVTRILAQIDWELLRRRNIPLCGYSDVSALLLAAYEKGCQNLIHGPMLLSTYGNGEKELTSPATKEQLLFTHQSFTRVLQGDSSIPLEIFAQLQVLKVGHAQGKVIPVNLTLLESLLGTPFQPNLHGCILILEDVHEPAHAIERRLVHLREAGLLSQLSALLFGDFTEAEDGEYLPEILQGCAEWIPGPVYQGLPFGHGKKSLCFQLGALLTI